MASGPGRSTQAIVDPSRVSGYNSPEDEPLDVMPGDSQGRVGLNDGSVAGEPVSLREPEVKRAPLMNRAAAFAADLAEPTVLPMESEKATASFDGKSGRWDMGYEGQAQAKQRNQKRTQINTAQAEKAARVQQFKQANSEFEAKARATGADTYTDAFGVMHQTQDEQGRPLFRESQWERQKDEKTGKSVLVKRNRLGQTEVKPGRLVVSKDPADPVLYRDFGDGAPEAAGHVDDLVNSADPAEAAAARALKAKREKAIIEAGREPVVEQERVAQQSLLEAKQKLEDPENGLRARYARLQAEISTIPADTLKQTEGGFFGIGSTPTRAAQEAQARKTKLEAEAAQLAAELGDVEAKVGKDGELAVAASAAETARKLFDLQVQQKNYALVSERIAENAKRQGKKPEEFPAYLAAKKKEEEFGVQASEAAQAADAARAKAEEVAAARKAVEDPEQIVTGDVSAVKPEPGVRMTAAQKVEQLTAERAQMDADREKLAGEIDGFKAKQKAGGFASREEEQAEVDRLNSAQADLINRASSFSAAVESFDQKAKAADADKRLRGRVTAARGRELFELEKAPRISPRESGATEKAAARAKRVAELRADPAVVEARKAHAFQTGVSEGSRDLYAKGPGGIVFNPDVFKPQALREADAKKAAGRATDGRGNALPTRQVSPMPDWRVAVGQAVKAGDMAPAQAERMTQRMETAERLNSEAVKDNAILHPQFQRWVQANRPDLAKAVGGSEWWAIDWKSTGSALGNPEMRAAAAEWLAKEPSVMDEIHSAVFSAASGFVTMGTETVAFAGEMSNAAANLLRENDLPVERNPLYSVATTVGRDAVGMVQDSRQAGDVVDAISQGVGSSLGFALTGGTAMKVGRGLGLSPAAVTRLGSWAVASQGAAVQSAQTIQEARDAGWSDSEARGLTLLSSLIGASELVPVMKWAEGLGKGVRSATVRRLMEAIVREPVEELGQEVFQTAASNALAKYSYDESRKILEGVGDSAQAAAGSAALVSLITSAVGARRYARIRNQNETSLAELSPWRQNRVEALDKLVSDPRLKPAVELAGAADLEALRAQHAAAVDAVREQLGAERDEPEALLKAQDALIRAELALGGAAEAYLQRIGEAAKAADAIAAMPDYVAPAEIDPKTLQPVPVNVDPRTGRDAAAAIVRVGSGTPLAALTGEQRKALATIEQLEFSDDTGSVPVVEDVAGVPVVSQKAIEWLKERAPAAAGMIRMSEQELRNELTREGTTTAIKGKATAKQAGAGGVAPAPASAGGMAVEFTDGAGVRGTREIPKGATLADGSPVTEANAAQYLGEQGVAGVRDVKAAKKGQKLASQKTASQAKAGALVAPDRLVQAFTDRATKAGAKVDAGKLGKVMDDVSARVEAAVKAYDPIFKGAVRVVDGSTPGGGGVQIAADGALEIVVGDLVNPKNLARLGKSPERMGKIVQEEAIHAVAVKMFTPAEITEMWTGLGEVVQRRVWSAYRGELSVPTAADAFQGGHEALRMIVQGRLKVAGGKWSLDGRVSEQTAGRGVLERIAAFLREVRDYFNDTAANLRRDGATPAAAKAMKEAADAVEARVRELLALPSVDRSEAAPYAPSSNATIPNPAPVAPAPAANAGGGVEAGAGSTGEGTADAGRAGGVADEAGSGGETGARVREADAPAGQLSEQRIEVGAGPGETGPKTEIAVDGNGNLTPGTRAALAEELGVIAQDIGRPEKVTHKGRTYWTVPVLIDAGNARTSHTADGAVNPDYPQQLQPRNRATDFYRNQQRKIAGKPNADEESKAGSPDSGPPIMAVVDGKPVTVIGNGRANAKALMYVEPDFSQQANEFKRKLPEIAAARGIRTSFVQLPPRPTLARVIVTPMTMAELREVSKESNEFAGAQTNAIEQARADADALTPGVIGLFEPEFDMMAARNLAFRQEFARGVFGESGDNIAEVDLKRRLQLALFAKAYGATPEGQEAFMRLAGESSDSTKNITNALFALAPDIAAMKDGIEAGALHPLDISGELARAAQAIGVALRDRPAGQAVDAALDGLVNQGDLGMTETLPLEAEVLRFLVDNRRSRVAIEQGLNAYVAAVYGFGDPKQADLFGADTVPSKADTWQVASEAAAAVPGRDEAAAILSSAAAERNDNEAADLRASVRAVHAQAVTQRAPFLRDIIDAARRAGMRADQDGFRNAVKRLETALSKLNRKPKVPSDLLRASVVSDANSPEALRAQVRKLVEAMARDGYRIYAPGGVADITDRHDGTLVGYKDIALKFVKEGTGLDPVVKEVLVLQRAMKHGKARVHDLYDRQRAMAARIENDLSLTNQEVVVLRKKLEQVTRRLETVTRNLYLADNPLLASVQSSESMSRSRSADSSAESSSANNRNSSSESDSRNLADSSALSGSLAAFSTSDFRSASERGLAFITPDTTAADASGQQAPSTLQARRASNDDTGDLFALMGVETAAQAYVEQLPAAAKKTKPALKREVIKDVPSVASSDALLGDLFAIAQSQSEENPLSATATNRNVSTNENESSNAPVADAGQDGGRTAERLDRDRADTGSLLGDAGPAGAVADEDGAGGTAGGNVDDARADRPTGGADGQGTRDGERDRGVRDDAGTDAGSLSGAVPAGGNTGGERDDHRSKAQNARVARIARSRARALDAQNHRIEEGDTLAEGGAKTRLRHNLAAIRLLKKLQAEKRNATADEKRVLARYVGWGALPQVFDRQRANEIERGDLDTRRDTVARYEEMASRNPVYQSLAERERAELQKLENWDNSWGEAYRQLEELLTPDEWEAARNSTENAHYTDRRVIAAMWGAVRAMGFQGGRVIEPGGGVGHFFGLMPDTMMRASELFGVELDALSGGIFQKLYPDAQVQVSGFEKAKLPDNAFDLAISNVPFSEVGPYDPVHDKAKLNLHNYFFAKALDKVRPGGLVAFITTSNTMEAQAKQRAYLAERADFVGAVRLPNNAFAANAGTQVTTDIIFLRKRDGIATPTWAQTWTEKRTVGKDTIPGPDGGEIEVPISVNEYFARNPDMVLGKHSMNGSMYAGPSKNGQYTVEPTEGDLGEKLAAALAKLPEVYRDAGVTDAEAADEGRLLTNTRARDGAFVYDNGELGIYTGGKWKTLADADPKAFGEGKAKARRKAADFVKLRDHYTEHLALMARPAATQAEIAQSMARLNELYDAFAGQWRTFEEGRHSELKTDPGFYMALGLERVETRIDPETGLETREVVKADVLRKRTIFPSVTPTTAASPLDALRISQSWNGRLDLDFMGGLLDRDAAEVKRDLLESNLAFENPRTGLLETREDYLSGKVREKLRQAEAAAEGNPAFARNVEALRAVQPEAVPVRHITPKLGGGWVPPVLIESFLRKVGFGGVKVRYTQVGESDKWTLSPSKPALASASNVRTYAGGGLTGLELLELALDQRTPSVTKEGEKKGQRVFDEKATMAAKGALKRLVDAWGEFAKSSDTEVTVEVDGQPVTKAVGEVMADAYNETFNGTVTRVYDGSHLTLPGSAPFLLGPPDQGGMRPHQKNGIWRAIQEGVAFLAHGVGAGKTRELIAIAMEWKRLGLAKKPMLVVHNPTLNQFLNETRKIYPGAKVLAATKEDLQKENRRAFAARVASGDWDFVILAHSSFNILDDKPEIVADFVGAQKREVEEALTARLDEIGAKDTEDKDAKKDRTVKQLVKMLRSLEKKLERALAADRKDSAIYFQDLGVDGLLVDEAHMYKKVPFATKMGSVAGLDMSSSDRATGLLLRLNHVRSINNGRNVVLATGTPITNTLAEVWNMIRLTNPQALKDFSVQTFDQFSAAFGMVVDSVEMNPAGKWVPRSRFAKFVNGTGLAAFIRSTMDVQLNLDLGQPQIANGGLTPVVTPRTAGISRYMDYLSELYERWQKLDGQEKAEASAIPLVIAGTAKAATMDMRLIDPTSPDDPNSKVNRAIGKVVEFYRQENDRKGVQIVFADQYRQISTDYLDKFAGGSFGLQAQDEDAAPEDVEKAEAEAEAAGGFNLYKDIKAKLVAQGIPADEIAVITDYTTDDERGVLFAQANAGKVRVLLGSTYKLGVGVNVQERLYALHHLDSPWTPADLEQRIGRAWRSGNRYAEWGIPIQNLAYGVERTMDAGRYQVIETKSRFVKQAMEGKGGFEFEDPAGGLVDAAAELKAQFTGDPRVMELVSLENQVRELELQRDAHQNRQAGYESLLASARTSKAGAAREISKAEGYRERLAAVAKAGIAPEALDDINARLKITEKEIQADGALQNEKARTVWARELAPGVTVTVYASGEVNAQGKVAFRANAVLNLDGQPWTDKGITSERAAGLESLLARSVIRAEDNRASYESVLRSQEARQAEAEREMGAEFPYAEELASKQARVAALRSDLQGKQEKPAEETPALQARVADVEGQITFDNALLEITPAQLFNDNQGLAVSIAEGYMNARNTAEHDDIVQEARIALVKAARGFEGGRGVPFAAYAGRAIRNALNDAYGKAKRISQRETDRLDAPAGEEMDGETRGSLIADENQPRVGASTEQAETMRMLRQVISELPERPRKIVEGVLAGRKFTDLGEELGTSKQYVAQSFQGALAVMRTKLKQRGVKGLDAIEGVLMSAAADAESDEGGGNVRTAPKPTGPTGSPAFKAWFGDSKVVDAEGKPLVVYHGTHSYRDQKRGIDFGNPTVFDRNFAISFFGRKPGMDNVGSWFTTDAASAAKYGPAVMPVYLSIKKPFIITGDGQSAPQWATSRLRSLVESEGGVEEFRRHLKGEGYDGILIQDDMLDGLTGDVWLAMEPAQIKSAIGNSGAFDANNSDITQSAPGDISDADAIREFMADLERDLPADALRDNTARAQAEAEAGDGRTVGRPDLANPATTEGGRAIVNAVDETRKLEQERQTHEEWRQQAEAMLANDRDGVKRTLLEKASDPAAGGLSAVEVKAAMLLVDELTQRAMATRDPAALREAQILTYGYREARAETARSLGAGRDPFKTPEARAREFLASVIFRPSRKAQREIDSAPTPAEKSRMIARLERDLAAAKANTVANPGNDASRKKVADLTVELGRVRKLLSKTDALMAANNERMERIEKELAKMGVTLGDIFQGEVYLKLRGAKVLSNYAAKLEERRQKAFQMVRRGATWDEISRTTGLKPADVDKVVEEFRADFIAKNKAKFLAGLKAEDVDMATGPIQAGAGSVSEAEAMAEMERALEAMGFAKNQRERNTARKKMRRSVRRRGADKSAPVERNPGRGPVTDAELDDIRRGRPRGAQAEMNDPRPAVPPGAKLPPTYGPKGELINDATDARRGPGSAEYPADATGRAPVAGGDRQLGLGEDADAVPPVVDLTDPVQVAQVARLIHAIDGNGFDMVHEYWINAILSGPLTHVANVTGNTLNAALDLTVQRAVEAMVNRVTVNSPAAAQIGEFRYMIRGIVPGVMRGLHNAVNAFNAEAALFDQDVLNSQIEMDLGKVETARNVIPGRAGRIIRIPGRVLMFQDEFFKGLVAQIQVGAEAYRMGRGRGLSGEALSRFIAGQTNAVGSESWVRAAAKAKDLTFQNDFDPDTLVGRAAGVVNKARSDVPGLRYFVPFLRTVLNIFTTGVRKSPVGSLQLATRFLQAGFYRVRDGKPVLESYPAPQMVKGLAEQVIAWTAAAILFGAAEGDDGDEEKTVLITGSKPYDPARRAVADLESRTGFAPYTIRVGGKSFQYGRYEPIATVLGVTIDLIRTLKQSDKVEAGALYTGVARAIADQVTSKTFAQGLGDLFATVQDPREAVNWASNFAASFVPNILRQPVRNIDPYLRESSLEAAPGELGGRFVERVAKLAVPLPGMQEPKITPYGDKVMKPGNAASRLVIPGMAGDSPEVNRIDRMLVNYNQANPGKPYAPSKPSRRIERGGKPYYLNDEEYRRFSEESGKLAMQMLGRVPINVETPGEKDVERVKNAFEASRAVVKRRMFP